MSYIENELRDAFESHRDRFGLIQPDKNPGDRISDNGILFTSQYIGVLWKGEFLNDNDRAWFIDAINGCEIEPGLYRRFPGSDSQEGPDDYVGLASASWMLKAGFAEKIFQYGKKSWWVFNNQRPGSLRTVDGKLNPSSWMFRFPALIAHFHFCCNKMPNIFLRIYWSISLILAAMQNRKNQDARVFSWFMIQPARGKSWICDFAIRFYWKRFYMDFSGGMRQVFSDYFNDFDHPCAKYFMD